MTPSVDAEFVLDENQVLDGLFLQDSQKKYTFQRFVEVLLVDSTHKTNDCEMPFFVMMGIHGEGESHVLVAFPLIQEDEFSICKMARIFKKNAKWTDVHVVITDRDMSESTVFKSELPQLELQICLFHVLRTFGREMTVKTMSIMSAQRCTLLDSLQEIVYSRNVDECQRNYDEFCAVFPKPDMKDCFDWHTITTKWVQGLKTDNYNTSTKNRLENFLQKLKSILPHKRSNKDLLAAFLGLLVTIRTEPHYRAKSVSSKVPTNTVQCSV